MSEISEIPGLASQAARQWRYEADAVVRLAAPLALTQLALMGIITTDVIMMGWLGSEALAAGTLAGHYFWIFESFGIGLLSAVAPILSQHLGVGLRSGAGRIVVIAAPYSGRPAGSSPWSA